MISSHILDPFNPLNWIDMHSGFRRKKPYGFMEYYAAYDSVSEEEREQWRWR